MNTEILTMQLLLKKGSVLAVDSQGRSNQLSRSRPPPDVQG